MNVGIGTVVAQFLFFEYLSRIFGIVSFLCVQLKVNYCMTKLHFSSCNNKPIYVVRLTCVHGDNELGLCSQ